MDLSGSRVAEMPEQCWGHPAKVTVFRFLLHWALYPPNSPFFSQKHPPATSFPRLPLLRVSLTNHGPVGTVSFVFLE